MLLTYYSKSQCEKKILYCVVCLQKINEQWVDEIVCNMQLIERFDANINSVKYNRNV